MPALRNPPNSFVAAEGHEIGARRDGFGHRRLAPSVPHLERSTTGRLPQCRIKQLKPRGMRHLCELDDGPTSR